MVDILDTDVVNGDKEEQEDHLIHRGKKQHKKRDSALTYADDIMGQKIRNTLRELLHGIEETYYKLKQYCNFNSLKLNSDKTHFMIIKSNQRRRGGDNQTVDLDGDLVEESRHERVLGLIFSITVVDWGVHLENLMRDCSEKLSALTWGGSSLTSSKGLKQEKQHI